MSATPPATPGLLDNLKGATDVMLGRDHGLQRMDLSANGFKWSFGGLLLVLFIDMSALSAIHDSAIRGGAQLAVTKPAFIIGKLLSNGLSYLAAMVSLYLLCREPEEQARFPTAVIAHNWAAPVVSLAALPIIFVSFNASSPEAGSASTLLTISMIALLVLVGVRLIRISLDIPLLKASLFFAFTTLVSLLCKDGLERLLGLQTVAL